MIRPRWGTFFGECGRGDGRRRVGALIEPPGTLTIESKKIDPVFITSFKEELVPIPHFGSAGVYTPLKFAYTACPGMLATFSVTMYTQNGYAYTHTALHAHYTEVHIS